MSGQLDAAKNAARLTLAGRFTYPADLVAAVNEAFGRVKSGEFGEPAVAGEASIEQFQGEDGTAPPIKLFIQNAEEAVDYSPEQLRELAFNLLAMAEISEALFKGSQLEVREGDQLDSVPGGAVEAATSFLARVEKRAKELYALSDQGKWEDLPESLQRRWINAAGAELRGDS